MAVAVREVDVTGEVAAIVGDLIDRGEKVSIHVVRDKIRELLNGSGNPGVVAGVVEWFMTYGVPQIVRAQLGSMKRAPARSRFDRMYVHVGEGVHKPLGKCLGREVQFSIDEAAPRLLTEFREQLFKRAIVKRVGMNQSVEKKLTNAELAKLWVTVGDKTIEWTEV